MFDHIRKLADQHHLVLGSGSPRRQKFLSELNISFTISVPSVDESARPGENPLACARRLASAKALAVAQHCDAGSIVVGGDTVVFLDHHLLGKPNDAADALNMLRLLQGKTHVVATGLALANSTGLLASGVEQTRVIFRSVADDRLREYIATGESMDKAGAYGAQGMGAFLVDSIEGNLDTVIGLPRELLNSLAGDVLRREGIDYKGK